jgi:CBS domain-containing protein
MHGRSIQPAKQGGLEMTVGWILREKGRHVVSTLPETPLAEVIRLLAEHRIGAIVVTDAGHKIMGIISERDIVRSLAEEGASILSRRVADAMTRTVSTCTDHHSVDWVMGEMTAGRFRHMPVTDRGCLAGLVSIGDVVKYKLALAEAEAAYMREYIAAG